MNFSLIDTNETEMKQIVGENTVAAVMSQENELNGKFKSFFSGKIGLMMITSIIIFASTLLFITFGTGVQQQGIDPSSYFKSKF